MFVCSELEGKLLYEVQIASMYSRIGEELRKKYAFNYEAMVAQIRFRGSMIIFERSPETSIDKQRKITQNICKC